MEVNRRTLRHNDKLFLGRACAYRVVIPRNRQPEEVATLGLAEVLDESTDAFAQAAAAGLGILHRLTAVVGGAFGSVP